MTQIIGYIRVSDSTKQDSDTQRHTITEYASNQGLVITDWVEENISGSKTTANERAISNLVATLSAGDHLICTEVSRLGREKALAVMSLIPDISEHGATLHLAYSEQAISPENADNAEILFTVVGASYVARQEAQKRAERAKAACNRRAAQGLSNGRQKGALVKSKLDEQEDRIIRALNDGESQAGLARELNVGRSTLINWLKNRDKIRRLAIDNFKMKSTDSLANMKTTLKKQVELPI